MRFWGAPPSINDRLEGETALAWAPLPTDRPEVGSWPEDSWLVGTREALWVVSETATRTPWEAIATAQWDPDTESLAVVGVDHGPARVFVVDQPGRVLELIRERVTASVVVQRAVAGLRGVSVVARRPPAGGAVTWAVEYPAEVDLSDPDVTAIIGAAMRAAQAEFD